MAETISGDKTQPLDLSVDTPDNLEDADAEQIKDVARLAANGIARVATLTVADLASLAAVAPVNGERFYVSDIGFYEYRSGSAAGVASPYVINGPGGAGRFHKIANINRLVGVYSTTTISGSSTTSTSYADAMVLSLGALKAGDIIVADAQIASRIINGDAALQEEHRLKLSRREGGDTDFGTVAVNQCLPATTGNYDILPLTGTTTVAADGNVSIVVKHARDGGVGTLLGTGLIYINACLRAQVFRP